MAIQSSQDYNGLTAPTSYSKIVGLKWVGSRDTVQVFVNVYATQSEYDNENQPLTTRIYTLGFPVEQSQVPASGTQALHDAITELSSQLYSSLLGESDYTGGSIVP